jgi:hypothetical protein
MNGVGRVAAIGLACGALIGGALADTSADALLLFTGGIAFGSFLGSLGRLLRLGGIAGLGAAALGVAILANTVELPDGVVTVLFLVAVFIPVALAVELDWRESQRPR